MQVEVAYATSKQQKIINVTVAPQCTVREAIKISGILALFPEIDLDNAKVGIFSKKVALNDLLKEGDRVEIYRPLVIDPKEARLLRARRKG